MRTEARIAHRGWTTAFTLALMALLLAAPSCGSGEEVAPAGAVTGFEEVAETAGLKFHNTFLTGEQGETFKINLYDHGSGVCVGDVNGDRRDDIYLLNQLGPNALFLNNGDGTFRDTTAEAGIAIGDRICSSGTFADIDNDGDQDLFVGSTRGGNLLYRNDGKGHFEDITAAAGLELVAHTQGVSFFDYDSDGDLDLYITNTAGWTLDFRDPEGKYYVGQVELFDLVQSKPEKNVLYRNEGDGTFVDVTQETNAAGEGWGGDIATFDADGDGDQDLFVTNMFGISILLRNEEGKRFTNVTRDALGITSWGAVGCKPMDYDGDGLLDLIVADMHSDMWMSFDMTPKDMEPERRFGGPEGPMEERGLMDAATRKMYWDLVLLDEDIASRVIFGSTIYRNLGNGQFKEVSSEANIETLWPWSIATADYDMDGREDVFIASGMGYPYMPWPNALLMNVGDGTFASRAKDLGIDPRPGGGTLRYIRGQRASRSSRSAAVIDFDADGRPDLVVNNFNERPYLYRNRFPQKHWVALRLRGTRSNRDAIGAVARIEAGKSIQVRQVCGAGGYLAQSTLTLYFGLGENEKIDRCVVTWPSGTKQVIEDVAIDRLHDVIEPGDR